MNNHIVESYIQNPTYNKPISEPTITQHQGNTLCGDDITVYLSIKNNIVADYGYDGNCSNITKAAASFLGDIIIGAKTEDVLSRNLATIEKEDFIVSPRRKRAAVIALLATRNAIHKHLQSNTIDTFEDLLY